MCQARDAKAEETTASVADDYKSSCLISIARKNFWEIDTRLSGLSSLMLMFLMKVFVQEAKMFVNERFELICVWFVEGC